MGVGIRYQKKGLIINPSRTENLEQMHRIEVLIPVTWVLVLQIHNWYLLRLSTLITYWFLTIRGIRISQTDTQFCKVISVVSLLLHSTHTVCTKLWTQKDELPSYIRILFLYGRANDKANLFLLKNKTYYDSIS